MAYIQQRGERKYKITVCNSCITTGKNRMQVRTIDVPREIPKRGIRQYLYAEAARLEKRFRTDIDESETTVHKHLDAVSAVLQDAAKNDILLYNPAHRVEKVRVEKVYHAAFLRHLSAGTWHQQAGGSRPAGTRRYCLSGTNLLPSAGCLQRGGCRVV